MIVKPPNNEPLPSDPRHRAGAEAERQMAFYLHRDFSSEVGLLILNDLRLVDPDQPEHDGRPGVCQIDHLVLHRWGAFIVESKSVTDEVSVRDDGTGGDEWTRRYRGRDQGLPSPIQQARRQGEYGVWSMKAEESVDADGAERLIRQLKPDVVFVDIEMPGRDGLAVVDRLGGKTRSVVMTAFEEYAVEAFDTAAVDYLLKPVTAARLARTLARLARGSGRTAGQGEDQQATGDAAAPPGLGTASDARIPLAAEGVTALVTLADILWIEAAENYSRVYRAVEPVLFVRQSLARWEELLPAESFLRVSRSVILRLDRIEGIRWNWQQGTQLSFVGSDARLTIGRSAARRLKDRLAE